MSLEKETQDKESEKFECIGRAEIGTHTHKISVPQGATLLRTKSGFVKFFRGPKPEGTKNGWSDVPEDAILVQFSGYREKSGDYGSPTYYS